MTIQQRQLGTTGEHISVLGYGAMELRGAPGGPPISDKDASVLLNEILDRGISLIDTAVDYGRSEELIGRYVGHRRDEYFLASKCGCPLEMPPPSVPPPYPHDYRVENIRAGVEQSLRRLRTDRLDLLQVHMSPGEEQLRRDDVLGTLARLRDEGKVRFIGMSATLPNLARHIEMGVFDVFQVPYSAVQREHEQLIADAAASGAGVLVRGAVARGGPAPEKDWQLEPIGLPPGEGRRRWTDFESLQLLGGMSPMEFMLRFALSHPALSSAIVGTSSVRHLLDNVAIAEKGPLPDDHYARAKERLAPVHRGLEAPRGIISDGAP